MTVLAGAASRTPAALLLTAFLANCASTTTEGFSPGFFASPVGEDGFFVRYDAGAFVSTEMIEAYWLYNTAILVLKRGYDGFEIVSSSSIVVANQVPVGAGFTGGGAIGALLFAIVPGAGGGKVLQENIEMRDKASTENNPAVLNASILKNTFEPCVIGTNRNAEQCKHPLEYLTGEKN